MFAVLAAIVFLILLFLDLIDKLGSSDLFNWNTLVALGLFFLALHFAGFADTYHHRWTRSRRR